MSSPLAGPADGLAGRQVRSAASGLVLPDGPRQPRIVQAWLWLKKPTWFLDHCRRTYGDGFTMRLPLGNDLVHMADPELVKAVFGGNADALRAGEANGAILEPLLGPNSVLVLDGPEHLRQRKLMLPAFHGDRMRAWDTTIRDITRAEIARWPTGKPFALRPSMQSITLDVIVRLVFGVEDDARRDDLRRRIVTVTRIGRNPFLLFATRDRKLGPHAPWARFIRARDAWHAALGEQIGDRRRAPDLEQRSDVLWQLLLPGPAARGPVCRPRGVPAGAVRRAAASGVRLASVRRGHPAMPGRQLRHLRDAGRAARGAASGDAPARLAAAGPGPPGGGDVRPARRRALRGDRPAPAAGGGALTTRRSRSDCPVRATLTIPAEAP